MQRWILCVLVIFVFVTNARSEGDDRVVISLDYTSGNIDYLSEYIRDWMILGPFFPNDIGRDFLEEYSSQRNVDPLIISNPPTAKSPKPTWKKHSSRGDIVDFQKAIGYHSNYTAYAFCYLRTATPGEFRFLMASNSAFVMWINGKEVYNNPLSGKLKIDGTSFTANLKKGLNSCIIKFSTSGNSCLFSIRALKTCSAVVSGVIVESDGIPVYNADVRLQRKGKEVARATSDYRGRYRLLIHPVQSIYDLSATKGKYGNWETGIHVQEGMYRRQDLKLKPALSIKGKLLMGDGKTPHVAVPVQVIESNSDNKLPVSTVLSNNKGEYQFINLKPGKYKLRCQTDTGYVYYAGENKYSTRELEANTIYIKKGETTEDISFKLHPFKKWTWKNYTYLDGLAYDIITDICGSKSDGNIWFATAGGGISCFDSNNFKNINTSYGLASDKVNDIHIDDQGNIWLATDKGLLHYDNGEMIGLTSEDGLLSNNVNCVSVDSKGAVWCGTNAGISSHDGIRFSNLTEKDGLVNNNVRSILFDNKGSMWIGTDRGVSYYSGGKFTNFTKFDGLINNKVYDISLDPDGLIWFATDGGASLYDGNNFKNITKNDGLASNCINSIYIDKDENIWFGTKGGASRYDGESFVNLTTADGMLDNNVNAIYQDQDGFLWFGTGNATSLRGGVSCLNKEITCFGIKDGLVNNNVTSICSDEDGNIWFATLNGISYYDGKGFVSFKGRDSLPDDRVWCMQKSSNNSLWFGTSAGIYRFSDGNFIVPEKVLSNFDIRSIYLDEDDAIWFGTYGDGIFYYNGTTLKKIGEKSNLTNSIVRNICQDKNNITWIGTDEGVYKYDGNTVTAFNIEPRLINKHINTIYCDSENRLWFGTDKGVFVYDDNQVIHFTTEDSLSHNIVLSIYQDQDGLMWFGTDGGGVSIYDGTVWSSLDTRDGFNSNSIFSIYQDSDGFHWFGTQEGVIRYERKKASPKIEIVSLKADQSYNAADVLPDFEIGTRITIFFNSMDFRTAPEKRQYRYSIDTAEPNWSKPIKNTSIDYIFEKPGDYNFRIQAIDRNINYSEPITIKMKVAKPPFYKHNWFLVITILVVFLIPTLAYTALTVRQRNRVFKPLPNPFIVDQPVSSDKMFVGRNNFIQFIQMRLSREKQGVIILLTGERKTGKTSMILQIERGILGERVLPVFVDIKNAKFTREEELLKWIARDIKEIISNRGFNTKDFDLSRIESRETFSEAIAEMLKNFSGRRLILLFDDYEEIEERIENRALGEDFPAYLAELIKLIPNLVLILTGPKAFDSQIRSCWHSVARLCSHRQLRNFSKKDILELIKPIEGHVIYAKGIFNKLLRMTAGHPYYTQLLFKNLVDRLNTVERNIVRQSDVEYVINEIIDKQKSIMMEKWKFLEPYEQKILSSMAQILNKPFDYNMPGDLSVYMGDNKSKKVIESIMFNLSRKGILERNLKNDGKCQYRFSMDIFRLWVRGISI
ncbi:hypothetical protein GF312_20305 [Candidatus Poribacteria bacterium]|nr:hypothetical protein [Candidatus Poribacteria bacterium]